jgi:hypothetical protein
MGTLKNKSISSTYQNLLQTSTEVKDTNLKQVESGSGNSSSMKLSTNSAEFLKVGIGTGGTTPDGLLHVMSVSAGSVTSDSSANQLTLENSSDSGLSIISGSSHSGNIFFGSSSGNKSGQIYYDHGNGYLGFASNGSETMRLDSNGNLKVSGTLSGSEDRYELKEYFEKVPSLQTAAVTQATNATTAVTLDAKYGIITMQSHDLAATDTVEFTFNNTHIFGTSSHVHVQLHDGGTIADNAMVNVLVHDVADGSCKIRIGTNGTDVAAQVFKLSFIIDPYITPNQNFVLSGVNAGGSQISGNTGRSTTFAGIKIVTNTTDEDKTILAVRDGHTEIREDVDSSGWASVPFGTENKIEFSSAISTSGNIADSCIWAGLKLTSDNRYAIDANQAYFLYSTDDDQGALTTNGNLHFVYSVANTDYITDLGIVLAINTVYRLRISFDENRQISVYVNNVRYGLVTTATAGGATQSVSTTKSLAMTDDIDLLPFIGIETKTTSSKGIQVGYVKLSRDLYE